uniref:hypothetical protein n=1 Tax=Enterococcus faecalis TaxID=1351 RepID=UPI00155DB1FC|nr:hypothetical protein [Enterococcus faecalis]
MIPTDSRVSGETFSKEKKPLNIIKKSASGNERAINPIRITAIKKYTVPKITR